MKVLVISIVVAAFGKVPKGWGKRIGNQRWNRDYTGENIIKIGKNTEKSPGDLRRLAANKLQ